MNQFMSEKERIQEIRKRNLKRAVALGLAVIFLIRRARAKRKKKNLAI